MQLLRMTKIAPPSLRERRKAETWTALHEAAASLALERGLEHATVEAIAESVGVSSRTFFNYFRAKEDAVLGLQEPVLDPQLLSRLSSRVDLVRQVSRLLVAVARTALGSTDALRRRQLMTAYPHLAQRQMEYMVKAEALVCEAVASVLAGDPSWAAGAEGFGADDTARMLVMIAGVPVRFNLTSASYDPVRGLRSQDLDPSLDLLRQLQRKLS